MLNQPQRFKTACRVCRDRKVKCDKVLPCRNCTAAEIVCSFPPQVRTVRRPKRAGQKSSGPADKGLLDRVNRLEALLQKHAPHLRTDDAEGNMDDRRNERIDAEAGSPISGTPLGSASADLAIATDPSLAGYPIASFTDTMPSHWSQSSQLPSTLIDQEAPDSSANDTGYWKRLEQECASHVFLKTSPSPNVQSKPATSKKQENAALPQGTQPLPESGFPFPHSLGQIPPRLLPLTQRRVCWARYIANVDPLLKILHKPTVEGMITVRDVHHYKASPSIGALIHAVCLLAVISMPEKDVTDSLECERAPLERLCSTNTEQALMAANFLDARDMITMQALLLHLYYLKHQEDSRLYALRGVAIFLAARMGLNRDRVPLGTSRLEAELRRRLWWQLITLVDHPDDCGVDYIPPSVRADTRLPLNVNDSELEQPDSFFGGQDHRRFTESSFSLMQYEITGLFNRIRFERAHASEDCRMTLDGAEQRLSSSRQKMESQYFQDSVEDWPIAKFAAHAVAMILAKRRVLIHISPDLSSKNTPLSPGEYDHLFLLGIHVLELSRALQTARNFENWRWLSATYFQWSVANFVVKDLATRPKSPATKRAWNAINGILSNWPEQTRNSPKAVALNVLIADAARHRDEQNVWNFDTYSSLDGRESFSFPPETSRSVFMPQEKRRESPSGRAFENSQTGRYPLSGRAVDLEQLLMSTPKFDEGDPLWNIGML